jgi:hypothetical protein
MIVTSDMLQVFLERMQYNRHRPVSYKYALYTAVQAAIKLDPTLDPMLESDHHELEASLVAECVMSHLYDFASSYNSESISDPILYANKHEAIKEVLAQLAHKHEAIKEVLAQLARGTFSLYDNPYQEICSSSTHLTPRIQNEQG